MKIINRKTRCVSHALDPRIESKVAAGGSGPGELTGYLAVFGNIDSGGEIINKGAFARSISQKLSNGKTLPLMQKHFAYGGDTEDCIGSIVEAKEDDYGLWIRAVYATDAASQSVRTKVAEGHVKGLSVGFYPVRWECRPATTEEQPALVKSGREDVLCWIECELGEGTVTCRPMNEQAEILTSKSNAEACPHCKQKNDATPSTAALTAVTAGTAKTASVSTQTAPLAKTASFGKARRKRELELLGVI